MILTVFVMGVTLLAATTIGGLLTLYQIQAVGDISASIRSIYAADAGIEYGLYKFFKPSAPMSLPTFPGGATVVVTCQVGAGVGACTDPNATLIRSVGSFQKTNRAFELPLTPL